jgi:glyoxylase-like metal-dependent hydrolase (beta-lactamase superfamily II)
MSNYICITCGVQFSESNEPPATCAICNDERQFVGFDGQQWTTLEAVRAKHHNVIRDEEPGVKSIVTEPRFGIGQRALAIENEVLWDCVTLPDDAGLEAARGVKAMALSHPHYYSAIVEWSRALGKIPVYLHEADRQWVMRPDPCIEFWSGDVHQLAEGLTLVRCGGHFEGGSVLHWAAGAEGRGALLTGDIIQVVPDRRWVSFMYSYPNLVPLPARTVRDIVARVEPYPFDRLYGAWTSFTVATDAKGAVRRSAERYIAAIS